MEEDKALGESSNTDGNSSISNHNNNDGSHSNNSNSAQQPSSSSLSSQNADDSDSEDVGWWDCSLCTYRNSTDKFKCEICDLRRGTSTRKPRCNADTSVDLVKKQQEQIRRQTIHVIKTPKSSSTKVPNLSHAVGTTPPPPLPPPPPPPSQQQQQQPIIESPVPKAKSSPKVIEKTAPFEMTPLEVNGNLIKYLPPTSTGRTGLIIDKKRFSQHSVTVNDVTITFTEFATRQNKYIRKKKKHRDVSQPKSNSGDKDN